MPQRQPGPIVPAHAAALVQATAIAVTAALVLAVSAPGLAIVWDEGEYLGRALHISEWLRLLWTAPAAPGPASPFSAETIRAHWQFITWSEGHPAFGAIPTALTSLAFGQLLHPLTAARLGPIAVFGVAVGLVSFRLRQAYGTVAALVAAAALLTFPRLFAEAHYVTLDGQLTAWWLAAWAVEARPRRHWRDEAGTSALVGVLAGFTCAVKFSGWAIWPPLVLIRLIAHDRWRRAGGLLVAAPVALLTYFAVNPPLWHDVVATTATHLTLNLRRTLNIPVQFLGTSYDLTHSLPWYNTLVWLVIVTPVPLLVLGAVGAWSALRRFGGTETALLLHCSALLVVRALPGTPPHDGVRLFLPALGFWCVLAGVGAHRLLQSAAARSPRWRLTAATALVLALAGGAVNLARYYPQPLAHYNLLAGGVRGAAALGMEPTYWWDALDRRALAWLNAHTGAGEAVAFSAPSNIGVLRDWGWLQPEQANRRDPFKWYVIQNRTAMLSLADRHLLAHAVPAYVQYAGSRVGDGVPWDLRVPLLLVFGEDQYRAALAAIGAQ